MSQFILRMIKTYLLFIYFSAILFCKGFLISRIIPLAHCQMHCLKFGNISNIYISTPAAKGLCTSVTIFTTKYVSTCHMNIYIVYRNMNMSISDAVYRIFGYMDIWHYAIDADIDAVYVYTAFQGQSYFLLG
jgi:hypothetical protein